jgi:hypothetical protein
MDKLDELLAKMSDPEVMEAARLAKMARVKPPRMQGSMAGDVTTGLGRTKKDMEKIARGGAKNMKYGGKAQKMEEGGLAMLDPEMKKSMTQETGNQISDADRKRLRALMGMGKVKGGRMSDADKAKIESMMNPERTKKLRRYKYGGKVEKMMDGGEAGGSCRGGGAALRGTKFTGTF